MTRDEYRAQLWREMNEYGLDWIFTVDGPYPDVDQAAREYVDRAKANETRVIAELVATFDAREIVDAEARPRAAFDLDRHIRTQAAKKREAEILVLARPEFSAEENTASQEPTRLFDAPAAQKKTGREYETAATRGERERDEAMRRVDENAEDEWKTRADAAILKTGLELATFTSDDVWNTGLDEGHDPRALGPRMNTAARRGLIEKTGSFIASERRHMTPIVEWRLTSAGREAALRKTEHEKRAA